MTSYIKFFGVKTRFFGVFDAANAGTDYVISRRKSLDGHATNASLSTDFFHTQSIQIKHDRVRWLSRRLPIQYRISGIWSSSFFFYKHIADNIINIYKLSLPVSTEPASPACGMGTGYSDTPARAGLADYAHNEAVDGTTWWYPYGAWASDNQLEWCLYL